jgi:hypothetical protein
MMELYLQTPRCLHSIVLNKLSIMKNVLFYPILAKYVGIVQFEEE